MDDSFLNLLLTVEMQSFVRCVCVCVCERERERERERETGSHHSGVSFLNRSLFANTYEHHHCVCHTTLFLSRAWTDGKTNNIITCSILKAEARDYCKVRYISDERLWCSSNHNALGQLANQSRLCLSEGGALKKMKRLREAEHRRPTIIDSIWKIMCFLNIKACQHILFIPNTQNNDL